MMCFSIDKGNKSTAMDSGAKFNGLQIQDFCQNKNKPWFSVLSNETMRGPEIFPASL